jgi:hypothetical protein
MNNLGLVVHGGEMDECAVLNPPHPSRERIRAHRLGSFGAGQESPLTPTLSPLLNSLHDSFGANWE